MPPLTRKIYEVLCTKCGRIEERSLNRGNATCFPCKKKIKKEYQLSIKK